MTGMTITKADKAAQLAFQRRLDEWLEKEMDALGDTPEEAAKGVLSIAATLLDAAVCMLYAARDGDHDFVRKCVMSGTDKSIDKMDSIAPAMRAQAGMQ